MTVSSNVVDNTIVDSDLATVEGRYIVPATGTLNDFSGQENKYADYDGTAFSFSTPNENDIVLIISGTNIGQFWKYVSGTWQIFTKTTGLPVYLWASTNSYKANDLCIYNNSLYQSNAAIPVNTAFVVGTTGATWKQINSLTWLYESGSLETITNLATLTGFSYGTSAWQDVAGGCFTFAIDVNWDFSYKLCVTYTTNDLVNAMIVDPAGNMIAGTRVAESQATANAPFTISGQCTVTTTGPTVYKLQARSFGTATLYIQNYRDTGTTDALTSKGQSFVRWKKVANFVPVTGQSNDYIFVRRTGTNQAVANNTTFIFNEITSTNNSIGYNTATGVFQLKAGVTYELDGTAYIFGTSNG